MFAGPTSLVNNEIREVQHFQTDGLALLDAINVDVILMVKCEELRL